MVMIMIMVIITIHIIKNGDNFNSKTNESHRFRLDLTDKINLKNPKKNMALANLSIITLGKTLNLNTTTISLKFLHQWNWNETFDIPDGSYSVSDIQDYFEFNHQKTWDINWKSINLNLCK